MTNQDIRFFLIITKLKSDNSIESFITQPKFIDPEIIQNLEKMVKSTLNTQNIVKEVDLENNKYYINYRFKLDEQKSKEDIKNILITATLPFPLDEPWMESLLKEMAARIIDEPEVLLTFNLEGEAHTKNKPYYDTLNDILEEFRHRISMKYHA